MKKILMVVFHYPPVRGSSGVHRALNFSRYLPQYGWDPIVLTVTPNAHTAVESDESRVPPGVSVERALAFDSARALSIKGTYPRALALPDRWVSWWPGGLVKGLSLIRRHRPHVIWSTFPIATAHLIALSLHRLSGLPWVADFRDPMTERDPVTGEEFPSDPAVRKVNGWIERPAIKRCARAVFTTNGTAEMYAQRFSEIDPSRWAVIPNGYDEESFRVAEVHPSRRTSVQAKKLVLLHSGTLYSHARDPRAFFEALAALRAAGEISATTLSVVLRGSGYEALYQSYLKELQLEDMVRLEGTVSYDEALVEMLAADGLLVFQASNCNWQIPAKIYEYLRARRPILAFTDSNGDTAKLLRSEGIDTIVPIDSPADIARGLRTFLLRVKEGRAPLATAAAIERHSRRLRTRELATLLDQLTDAPVALRADEAADAREPLGAAGYTRKHS